MKTILEGPVEQKCSKDRTRLSLDLSLEVRTRIATIQELTGATTSAEVVRRALGLYDLVVDVQSSGGRLILENSKGDQESIRIV